MINVKLITAILAGFVIIIPIWIVIISLIILREVKDIKLFVTWISETINTMTEKPKKK